MIGGLSKLGEGLASFGATVGRRMLDDLRAQIQDLDTDLNYLNNEFGRSGGMFGTMSGLAGAIASPMEDIVKSNESRLKEMTKDFSAWDKDYSKRIAELNARDLATRNPFEVLAIQEKIYLLNQEREARLAAIEAFSAQSNEYANPLYDYERQQEDQKFLQQQQDLIDMARTHGLDLNELMGGEALGLGADRRTILIALNRAMEQINQQQNEMLRYYDPEAMAQAEAERVRMLEEQARIERELAQIEKQRNDLAFLRQQMDLLTLIQEQGLDAESILGGMTLGLEANLADVISAMTRAMQAIVGQVNTELQISSPSRVFAGIGEQIMAGMAQGIIDSAGDPLAAMRAATSAIVSMPDIGGAGGAGAYNYQNATTYNLNVTSTATSQGIVADYSIMRAMTL
jgi:hypothetical protein